MSLRIQIPELALVVLIGPSGSGKSSFARKHFKPTEVLSSDFCRGLISDDENNQAVTDEAFALLHHIAGKRLSGAKLTVVDATNVQEEARKPLVALARHYHVLSVAIVFKIAEKICAQRNKERSDRNFGGHVLVHQYQQMRRSVRGLGHEGFRYVHVLNSPEEVDDVIIERQPLWTNRRNEHGPFDLIGDIHGCFDELRDLLSELGYEISKNEQESYIAFHPGERKIVFLGDLVDRGPKTPEVLKLVMDLVEKGAAICVPGNHDLKLLKKLQGRNVQMTHGLAESVEQLDKESAEFRDRVMTFLDRLISHFVLDDGKLVVAHAGMKEEMQGRASMKVRDFALYGETTGETDEFGLPIRYNWAADYRGRATVVYGHTPIPEPEWLNHTINIDTGCVFGGRLTALRYPEREFVSVPARFTYYHSAKPFLHDNTQAPLLTAQQQTDELLDIDDVTGKRIISTVLSHTITIREENAMAALEVMSRFAVNPRWLIYLPPTMSPVETSSIPDLLEHPNEAFSYYRLQRIPRVICQEKHMGSRAIVVLCRDEEAARKRFGVTDEGTGICYTRTGRPFFADKNYEQQLLAILKAGIDAAGLWNEFETDWFCFDCELMPWSVKARDLLRNQYAAVGAAARTSLSHVLPLLAALAAANPDVVPLLDRYRLREISAQKFSEAYHRYCWQVNSLDDLRLAPFHLLATEGKVHADKDHLWHMEKLSKICTTQVLQKTSYQVVDVTDPQSQAQAIQWWETLTEHGGEGMVVKPLEFVARGRQGLIQPAVKCRGREYLRIIYGPEYTISENLERLKSRGLSGKRSLALREFALGVEGLERFVRKEPLRRVHECVFGVLALETEPVDPRL